MANMKQLLAVALQWSLSTAAVIEGRSPQGSTTSPPHAHGKPAESLAGPLISALKGNYSEANLAAVLPKARLAQVKQLTPKLRPDAKRRIVQYGPYTLVGKGVGEALPRVPFSSHHPASEAITIIQIPRSERPSIYEYLFRWHM
jgi:hypothetical protein